MSAQAQITPARRRDLQRMLLRGVRDGRVDLGDATLPNWTSIDAFLIAADVSDNDLNALDRNDVDAVRYRLGRGATLIERGEAALEWLDESGLASGLLVVAIILAIVWWWRSLLVPADAAARDPGPEPSTVAGVLIAMVPVVFAVLCAAAAMRGSASTSGDEPFGDTTGFGERER